MTQGTTKGVPIDTDGTLSLNSNQVVPSQAAVVTYVAAQISASVPVPLTVDKGGTGATTLTNHGVLLGQATSAITSTAAGSAGQVLRSGGAGADPAYSTATYPATATGTSKVLVADGTNWVASTPTFPNASATSRKIIVSDGTNWIASTETYAVPGSSGNILTSDGTNWTSAAASSGGVPWSIITADQTAVINNAYICNKAGLLTITLPGTAAVGSIIGIINHNTAAGAKFLSANPGQLYLGNSSATANTGSFTSTALGDSMFLVCVVANTTWRSYGVQGNWTVA